MKTKISKIGRRGKIVLATFMAVMLIGVVSAGYLTYFNKVTTTMTAEQSVVTGDIVGEEMVWYNWDVSISRDFGKVVHCTDYTDKLWIWNRACVEAIPTFTDSPDPADYGVTVNHYVFGDTQTIELRQKDSNWEVINEDTIGADITFNTCGITFDYSIDYWGIEGEYSLIYYLDHYPRYEDWGHVYVIDNLILTGTETTTGNMDMLAIPFVGDWNAGPDADYGADPDNYEHIRGAKLWIVPTDNLVDTTPLQETILNAWTPAAYLFETDLALYIDCDDLEPPHLAYVYPLFATTVLQPETVYCWISCYHVGFYISPGDLSFVTTLTADPVT